MFWDKDVPRARPAAGVEVTVVAGALEDANPPAPPPDSWAANPEAELAIWLDHARARARSWTLPPAKGARTARTLYFFVGGKLEIEGRALTKHAAIEVAADRPVTLAAPDGKVEVLLMQGRPIGEPVAQYGPFVMNTRAELEQAFNDYRRTQFGGWPFPANDPVHPRERGRFARHADGRVEDAPRIRGGAISPRQRAARFREAGRATTSTRSTSGPRGRIRSRRG